MDSVEDMAGLHDTEGHVDNNFTGHSEEHLQRLVNES